MEELSGSQFSEVEDLYDRAVLETPDIYKFCSGSAWQLAAHETLFPPRDLHIFRKGNLWQIWASGPLYQFENVLQPLEAEWSFGCPVVGAHPEKAARFLLEGLLEVRGQFPLVWLGGVPDDKPLARFISAQFRKYFHLYRIPGCHCQSASLSGGFEGYLSRRSSRFRKRVGRVLELKRSMGIESDYIRNGRGRGEEFFSRVFAIESASWKGESGESIFAHERFRRFYARLIHTLSERDRLRIVFLRSEGNDIGYAMGGMLGEHYRGFQMAYRQQFAKFSPGHLAQIEMLQGLCDEGCKTYDLGMEMDYKARWADGTRRIVNYLLLKK